MKRRSKTGGRPIKGRQPKTPKPTHRNASKVELRTKPSPIAEEKEVARLARERDEALEQQTAAYEVLRVISSSPGDLKPVFATMLEKAARICDASFGNVHQWDGETLQLVASHNAPPAFALARQGIPYRPDPELYIARALTTKTVIQIADAALDKAYLEKRNPLFVAAVELGGVRTALLVPILKENEPIGLFSLYRKQVHPFTGRQIELVKNFAAQAVIAIENARLLNELRQRTTDLTEALEQQTATADVLGIISSSPGDLDAVFNKMLENATRICDAKFGTVDLQEEGGLRLVAAYGVPAAFAAARGEEPFHPAPDGILDTVMKTASAVHIHDLAATQSYAERHHRMVEAVEVAGIRTAVGVPMLRENELVGIIAIFRKVVSPFTDKQIELLTNFAKQAVIALENARLLNELRQSLERQTATSEVLQVISSSPGDLLPVFQTMLEKAVRICDAKFGNIYRWDGDALHLAATHNTPPALADSRRDLPLRPSSTNLVGRMLATKMAVHIANLADEDVYVAQREPSSVAAVELGGIRTLLLMPMLNESDLIGAVSVSARKFARLPTSRSRWFRTSPPRP